MKASFSSAIQTAYLALAPLSVHYLSTSVDGLKFMRRVATGAATVSGVSYSMIGFRPAEAPHTPVHNGWDKQFNDAYDRAKRATSAHLSVLDKARVVADVVDAEREAAATASIRSKAEARLRHSKVLSEQSYFALRLRGGSRDDDSMETENRLGDIFGIQKEIPSGWQMKVPDTAWLRKGPVASSRSWDSSTAVGGVGAGKPKPPTTDVKSVVDSTDAASNIPYDFGDTSVAEDLREEKIWTDDEFLNRYVIMQKQGRQELGGSRDDYARQEKEVTTTTCDDCDGYIETRKEFLKRLAVGRSLELWTKQYFGK